MIFPFNQIGAWDVRAWRFSATNPMTHAAVSAWRKNQARKKHF